MTEATIVTPEGVRDGDPAALRGLAQRRGAAVLAYAERVAAPGLGMSAAADAFARFRRTVVEAQDPYEVDPERTLLRATRFAAAAVAPAAPPLRARLRGGGAGSAACELVPELLAARAERDLGAADADRLARHVERCPGCRQAQMRFRAGELAYRDEADAPPPPAAVAAIVHALTAAAPARAPAPQPAVGPLSEPAPAAIEPVTVPAAPPFEPEPEREPEPVHHHQPTYEFDSLPAEAFDLEPPQPPPRAPGDPGGRTVRIVLPALILLVALVVALAVAGVFRA